MKPKVFITRAIPEKGLTLIRRVCDADVWQGHLPPSRETLLARVRGVDGILSLLTDKIDAAVMDAAGAQLKVISNYAVGYDNIDLAAAAARGIAVGNTPGILTDTTADFAFALLMAAARRVVEGERFVRAGKWQTWEPMQLLGTDIHGATLGIIGFGRIGKAMARRATGFGMRILYLQRRATADPDAAALGAVGVDWETLLRESDFVSLHTPLTPQTHHLMDARAFQLMKKSAMLINTARGGVVDPDALYSALKKGEIAFAALDVTEPEPIPADSPLLTLENVLITPHLGSASVATRDKMAVMAAENLLAGVRGEPLPNAVKRET